MPQGLSGTQPSERKLLIVSGAVAVITLAVPAGLWWNGGSSQCTGLGDPLVTAIVTSGLVAAVLALPVGIWMMISRRRLPWLAAPVGLLGLAAIGVGLLQVASRADCNHDTATTFAGVFAVLGGFGLLGLAAALLRKTKAPGA